MIKRLSIYLLPLVFAFTACLITACNGDNNSSYDYDADFSNCGITSFGLADNDNVLDNLSGVFFSVDLVNAIVFNADSLPKGTDVSHLIPTVNATAASKIEFTFKVPGTARDTTVNFTTNPGDSINFASPVTMTVTSYNALHSRDYTITVNVHNELCDTLYWDRFPPKAFPESAKAQKTVTLDSNPYTLLEGNDGKWYMCTTSDLLAYTWDASVTLVPDGADINTFAATTEALFISGADGTVYTSADKGASWSATPCVMHCIYGGYGSRLIGARHDSDGWKFTSYPMSGTETAVPSGCPVSGMSQLINYETKWSTSHLAIMIGGKDASGKYTGDTWGYDGSVWCRMSLSGIDERAGVTLVPYLATVSANATWRVTEESVLLAMGGIYETENGMVTDNKVYISYDFGIYWAEAGDYMQFPADFPGFHNAQAFSFDYTYPLSRISRPVTSWECPYIFLYGGQGPDGTLNGYLYRGVINRLTFKPIY